MVQTPLFIVCRVVSLSKTLELSIVRQDTQKAVPSSDSELTEKLVIKQTTTKQTINNFFFILQITFEPPRGKTNNLGFRTGPT